MGIRINRISINRGGPLKDDFKLEPAGLNLIYGHNETGKTYIVETMIDLLFRTGRNTPWILKRTKSREPTIRKWEPSGKIVVSGLEDEATVFTSGGKKFDDFRNSENGIPEDLSRILVVRGGDTRLSSSGDGAGDSILRTYLSGKGILDEIESNIRQDTVKKAIIANNMIEADQKGLISDRLNAEKEVQYLEALQLEADENASLCTVNTLEKSRSNLAGRLSELEDAKRHRAYAVHEEMRLLELDISSLPDEQTLIALGTDIGLHRAGQNNLKDIEDRISETIDSEDDYNWIMKAGEEYLSQPESHPAESTGSKVSFVLLLIFILLAAAAAFFSRPLTVAAAAGALVCMIFRSRMKSSPVPASAGLRQQKLEEEFLRRFHRELTDSAVLLVERQRMETEHIQSVNLGDRKVQFKQDIEALEAAINSRMSSIAGEEVPPDLWIRKMEDVRRKKQEVQESINSLRADLSSLNVPPDSYLHDQPAEQWDQSLFLKLRDELETVSGSLQAARQNIETLKTDISVAVGVNSRDLGQLLAALENRINTSRKAYMDLTSRILAENTVYRTLCEFRLLENAKLDKALESRQVISPLCRITDHYSGLRMDTDGYLHVQTVSGSEYPLTQLSTAAAEQVHIALRTGFAELSLGDTAFLIFDDAFQHSDWKRRKNLVNHIIELADSGWQIFYFTMDDHLMKLFDKSGRDKSQAGYKSVSLN